jgi:hypothetical protein
MSVAITVSATPQPRAASFVTIGNFGAVELMRNPLLRYYKVSGSVLVNFNIVEND